MLTYTAKTWDELSDLHCELEGMEEVQRDDGQDTTGFNEAIALIQQPGVAYELTGMIARRVFDAVENMEDNNRD